MARFQLILFLLALGFALRVSCITPILPQSDPINWAQVDCNVPPGQLVCHMFEELRKVSLSLPNRQVLLRYWTEYAHHILSDMKYQIRIVDGIRGQRMTECIAQRYRAQIDQCLVDLLREMDDFVE